MKQILIQLDDALAAQLEKVAPGRSRKRSDFLRAVIGRALQDVLEMRTRKAYRKWPDEPSPFDAAGWADDKEAMRPPAKRTRRRNAPGKRVR
ncbi:MAG TPA: hypothetical protein VI072_27000 [Polyangiaceae bacterium]